MRFFLRSFVVGLYLGVVLDSCLIWPNDGAHTIARAILLGCLLIAAFLPKDNQNNEKDVR